MSGADERFRGWAARHDLVLTDTKEGCLIQGEVSGVTVTGELEVKEVREVDETRRMSVQRYETLGLAAKPAVDVADLQVTPEGIRAKVSKLFGGQDIQLGDAAFDPVFLIRGRAPGVEKVLGPETRKALLAAHAAEVEVCIDGGRVVWRDDAPATPEGLDAVLSSLVAVAKAVGR